ncbi:hypothetical protein CYMTET_34976, partial [Cymbomonas tetramitiformis]
VCLTVDASYKNGGEVVCDDDTPNELGLLDGACIHIQCLQTGNAAAAAAAAATAATMQALAASEQVVTPGSPTSPSRALLCMLSSANERHTSPSKHLFVNRSAHPGMDVPSLANTGAASPVRGYPTVAISPERSPRGRGSSRVSAGRPGGRMVRRREGFMPEVAAEPSIHLEDLNTEVSAFIEEEEPVMRHSGHGARVPASVQHDAEDFQRPEPGSRGSLPEQLEDDWAGQSLPNGVLSSGLASARRSLLPAPHNGSQGQGSAFQMRSPAR